MGEKQNQHFQLSFNPSLKVDFQGSRVTSDSGRLLVRELDERLGLRSLMVEHLRDDRRGKNTQLPLPDLLRQSIYSRLAGYEDLNDAERLSQDPTFRLIGSDKIWERGAALPSRLHWFETEVLSQDENLESGPNQSETAGKGGGYGFPPAGGAGYGQHGNPGLWRTGAGAPTTGILSRPAITRCYCSRVSVRPSTGLTNVDSA